MKGTYKKGDSVLDNTASLSTPVITKSTVKQYGLCPKKNYFKTDENYVFFNGTVKHGYAQPERQFSMNGVT
jgi:hypothetical protein